MRCCGSETPFGLESPKSPNCSISQISQLLYLPNLPCPPESPFAPPFAPFPVAISARSALPSRGGSGFVPSRGGSCARAVHSPQAAERVIDKWERKAEKWAETDAERLRRIEATEKELEAARGA